MREYFKAEKERRAPIDLPFVVKRLVQATKLSRSTIERIEENGVKHFASISEPETRERDSTIPPDVQSRIRHVIANRYSRNLSVTIAQLHQVLTAPPAPDEPNTEVVGFPWSKSTLHTTLQRMRYTWGKKVPIRPSP